MLVKQPIPDLTTISVQCLRDQIVLFFWKIPVTMVGHDVWIHVTYSGGVGSPYQYFFFCWTSYNTLCRHTKITLNFACLAFHNSSNLHPLSSRIACNLLPFACGIDGDRPLGFSGLIAPSKFTTTTQFHSLLLMQSTSVCHRWHQDVTKRVPDAWFVIPNWKFRTRRCWKRS